MSPWAELPRRELADEAGLRVAVLVEGVSDAAAVDAAAERLGRDLRAEGICTVPMGGATNIRHVLGAFGRRVPGVRVAGLYDAAEERFFRRALGAGSGEALASLGFFACVVDLEDELIRAAGADGVEEVIRASGDARRWDTFRRQVAQRERTPEQQLRRFLGTTSGRKAHYARALTEALDPAGLPEPLVRLLEACG